VDEVLVDGRQLVLELRLQVLDDLRIALHGGVLALVLCGRLSAQIRARRVNPTRSRSGCA
jgi:hypothetical protein